MWHLFCPPFFLMSLFVPHVLICSLCPYLFLMPLFVPYVLIYSSCPSFLMSLFVPYVLICSSCPYLFLTSLFVPHVLICSLCPYLFLMSLFVPQLSFFWCLRKAMLHDFGISWVFSLIFLDNRNWYTPTIHYSNEFSPL